MYSETHNEFYDLEVWKEARCLKIEIFELVKSFPASERYHLIDQLIRSSRSITSNISEGHGRFTYKDQLHFCMQARGSLSETYNHLIDAFDCGYITEAKLIHFKIKVSVVAKLLNGYISFLRNKIPH